MLLSIRINHTVILDDPFDDPPGLPIPDRSPEPTKEQLDVSLGDGFLGESWEQGTYSFNSVSHQHRLCQNLYL